MANKFIPSFHFVPAQDKLKPEFCWNAVQWCWYQSNNRSLLDGKNVNEIIGYGTGDFDMTPFMRMYKSMDKQLPNVNTQYSQDPNYTQINNTVGVGFSPLPLIPTKINSARALVQKIPIEVVAEAIDALAAIKKNGDLTFLKNKPKLQAQLQELSDQMDAGEVDLGGTKHSSIEFSDSPYGLDLNEPDEYQVFVDIVYRLSVEAGIETALQGFYDIKKTDQIKGLEIKDQFYYGVSVNRGFESSITKLPDVEYIYPGEVRVPFSQLHDYSDNTHRFIERSITPMELFNNFGNEICDEEMLKDIVSGNEYGYCSCNKIANVFEGNFNTFKMGLVYCEIKSVDSIGIMKPNKKSKFQYFTSDADELAKCTDKIWAQNTYTFWWLKNTKFFFQIDKLPFSNRSEGVESFQNFSTNIYKSQEKSAVELSISENKKAQIADIKMQHAIIKSLPAGRYYDVRGMRNYLTGTKDGLSEESMIRVLNLAMEQNIILADTEGFEGKNDGQFKPVIDLPGGVKTEVIGYMQIIADADSKISRFTGINEQLTGQKSEELIGNNKLLISAGINALYHINEGIEFQYQRLFSIWATIIKAAIERGGKSKEAIVNLIGSKKVRLIDALDEVPLHRIGIKVSINQTEEKQQEFLQEIMRLKQKDALSAYDAMLINSVTNLKDKMALLAVKEKLWLKRQDKIRAELAQQQQAMVAQQGQNQQQVVAMKSQAEQDKIFKQGEVNAKILELANELGMQNMKLDLIGKKLLQQDRGRDQTNKGVQLLEKKQELTNQEAFQ